MCSLSEFQYPKAAEFRKNSKIKQYIIYCCRNATIGLCCCHHVTFMSSAKFHVIVQISCPTFMSFSGLDNVPEIEKKL